MKKTNESREFGIRLELLGRCGRFPLQQQNDFRKKMNNNEIKLIVVPSKPTYAVDEEISAEISIRNDGSESSWLNGRMLANTKHAPVSYRELTLVLTKNGSALPFLAKIRVGEVSPAEYVLLGSGASLTKEYCLSDLFDVQSPADYSLTAHFEDGSDSPPIAPSGSTYIKGPVESEECRFSVLEQ